MCDKRHIFVLILTSLVFSQAQASPYAMVKTTIDWSSFSITSLGIDEGVAPSIHWETRITSLYSDVYSTNSDSVESFDWDSSLTTLIGNATTSANTHSSLSVLHTYAYDADLSDGFGAFSNNERSGNFTVSNDGVMVFSFNYSVDARLEAGNYYEGWNVARANVGITLGIIYSNDSLQTVSDFIPIEYTENSSSSQHYEHSGTLSLTRVVKPGEHYFFIANNAGYASVYSPVPLPTGAWMFLSAVLGFMGLKRSRA